MPLQLRNHIGAAKAHGEAAHLWVNANDPATSRSVVPPTSCQLVSVCTLLSQAPANTNIVRSAYTAEDPGKYKARRS